MPLGEPILQSGDNPQYFIDLRVQPDPDKWEGVRGTIQLGAMVDEYSEVPDTTVADAAFQTILDAISTLEVPGLVVGPSRKVSTFNRAATPTTPPPAE